MTATACFAKDSVGRKAYQIRARKALPILVRQAEAKSPISYTDLAAELQMPNPRTLNYPLGYVGALLNAIAKEWDKEIPHIQSLVINKGTGLPGSGFDGFLANRGYANLNKQLKRRYLNNYWADIFAYPYWGDVLEACNLQRVQEDISDVLSKPQRGGGGEGLEHLALKEFVCANPSVVGLRKRHRTGMMEYRIPSADIVDIIFQSKLATKVVEIKSYISDEADIARGMFQCVKYKAVLEAESRYQQDHLEISACLVLGGSLPQRLIPLKNCLGIKVIEDVQPKSVR